MYEANPASSSSTLHQSPQNMLTIWAVYLPRHILTIISSLLVSVHVFVCDKEIGMRQSSICMW